MATAIHEGPSSPIFRLNGRIVPTEEIFYENQDGEVVIYPWTAQGHPGKPSFSLAATERAIRQEKLDTQQ